MFYDKMLQEKQRLTNLIEENKKKIQLLPEGSFYCVESEAYQKWYKKIKGCPQQYISKKDQEYAARLAYKRFLETQNADLEQELTAVNKFLENFPTTNKSQALLEKKGYQDLICKFFKPLNQELREWEHGHFTQNPYRPEGRIHHVRPGLSVRSKSEALIATQLHIHRIPFRYECALQIEGKNYYPDFTIRHPETGETFYWEHLGLLDNAAYTERAAQKMQIYAKANIYLNKNLILTSEGAGHPLTVQDIEKSIMYIIQ